MLNYDKNKMAGCIQIQIKITQLPSIGSNVAGNTLLPVVNTAGNAITNTLVFSVCDTKVSNETGYDVMINRFGQVQLIRHAGSNATKCSSV